MKKKTYEELEGVGEEEEEKDCKEKVDKECLSRIDNLDVISNKREKQRD